MALTNTLAVKYIGKYPLYHKYNLWISVFQNNQGTNIRHYSHIYTFMLDPQASKDRYTFNVGTKLENISVLAILQPQKISHSTLHLAQPGLMRNPIIPIHTINQHRHPTGQMPQHMAMKQPNARIIGTETQHSVPATGYLDGVTKDCFAQVIMAALLILVILLGPWIV